MCGQKIKAPEELQVVEAEALHGVVHRNPMKISEEKRMNHGLPAKKTRNNFEIFVLSGKIILKDANCLRSYGIYTGNPVTQQSTRSLRPLTFKSAVNMICSWPS